MSLSAITAIATGDQNCQVIIEWLSLNYALRTSNRDDCAFEFIVKNKEGILDHLDFYIPYRIFHIEDFTHCFLDEKSNGDHYESKFEANSKQREIKLNGIKAKVREISHEITETKQGTKITIKFKEPVPSGESRAVRLFYDCESLSNKDRNLVNLRYYGPRDINTLELDWAAIAFVYRLKVWIAFPPYTTNNIPHISYPLPLTFKPKYWEKEGFDPKNLEVFYGSKTQSLWKELPIRCRQWYWEDTKPVLIPGTNSHVECNYTVQKPEPEEETTAEAEQKMKEGHEKRIMAKEEKPEYRVWYENSEPSGKPLNRTDKERLIKQDKKVYSLFIVRDETLTQVFIKGKKAKAPRGKLVYRILTYVLKNKGAGGTAWNIAKHVWDVDEVREFGDLRELAKAIKQQPKIEAGKIQEKAEDMQRTTAYYSQLAARRIVGLNENFLEKLNTKLKANDEMDEYELTPPIKYCLIEKI